MQINASLIAYDVYLTMYNLASFPVASFQVTDREFLSPVSGASGTYLVRVHRNSPMQEDFRRDAIRVLAMRPDGKHA